MIIGLRFGSSWSLRLELGSSGVVAATIWLIMGSYLAHMAHWAQIWLLWGHPVYDLVHPGSETIEFDSLSLDLAHRGPSQLEAGSSGVIGPRFLLVVLKFGSLWVSGLRIQPIGLRFVSKGVIAKNRMKR